MAWNDLAENQMVSFTDASTAGFNLAPYQSNVTSNKCMSTSDITSKYYVAAAPGYSSNQLMPKGTWYGQFINLLQYWRWWNGMTVDSNTDVYACVNFGDIYKLDKSGTPPNMGEVTATNSNWNAITVTNSGDVYAFVYNGDVYKQTAGTGSFVAQGQTSRQWADATCTSDGAVYSCVNNGDIYKRVEPGGVFVGLGQTSRLWSGITVANNGDIYACVANGTIYKSVGGVGTFNSTGQANRAWTSMTTAPNGDIYACVENGDIYRQPNGGVDFIGVGTTSRLWSAVSAAANGDIYACTQGGALYKRSFGFTAFNPIAENNDYTSVTGMSCNSYGFVYLSAFGGKIWRGQLGLGEFIPTGQTSREWSGMASDNSGNVWACVWNGGIYKKNTSGVFVSLGQANRQWNGIVADNSGNVWACVDGGDIYKQTGGTGNFVATGQTSRRWTGMGVSVNGNIYACTQSVMFESSGSIYQYNPGTNNFVDLAVYADWVGLAGTPDNSMWAVRYDGWCYELEGSAGNNFVFRMSSTSLIRGICSSRTGNLYIYQKEQYTGQIFKN